MVTSPTPLSVSEVTARVKAVLEGGLPPFWVRGEISQFTLHRSAHCYFTLIDDRSQLSCVLWKGRSEELTFSPQPGQMVVAHGKVSVYERGGRYQFDCFELRPAGAGELALIFEALKKKLVAEGLFDVERKIPIPKFPERIGLVTSPEGAALQDILRLARERAPWVEFLLAPASVQGSGAAAEIAAGIRTLDDDGWPQIIIVGRGGGSAEDLWAFNEEAVVRAIANCRIPIISAVGHEVDITLADLAADLRAPTPSAAAEMCLPDREEIRRLLGDTAQRLDRAYQAKVTDLRRWLLDYAVVIFREKSIGALREGSQKADELGRRLESAAFLTLERRRGDLERLRIHHASLDPLSILARGYSVVRREDQIQSITDASMLAPKDDIYITFHKGQAEARVTRSQPN